MCKVVLMVFLLQTDLPGPPVDFVFEDVRKNSITCKWEPPLDDGGSEILNYVLEKKDNTKAEIGWVTVTSTLRHLKYNVLKLIEGKEYVFRVKAENRVGPGPPCVSKPVVAKDPFGEFSIMCVHHFPQRLGTKNNANTIIALSSYCTFSFLFNYHSIAQYRIQLPWRHMA